MRTIGWILALCAGMAISGCRTPVPRGHFYLPEDSFLTVKRIEALVPPGTPVEEARRTMEIHGFVCTFENDIGIPYLQCNQIKTNCVWPFDGTWEATLYYDFGVVRSVQAKYDFHAVERGTRIPKRTARQARSIDSAHDAAAAKNAASVVPVEIE